MKTATRTESWRPRVCLFAAWLVGLLAVSSARADKPKTDPAEDWRAGQNFIPTPVYSLEDDQRILKLFEGLRVSDVSDALDKVGLPNVCRMSPDIRPLWKDTRTFRHRFVGIAVTARYVPTQQGPPGPLPPEQFDRWVGRWYKERSSEPFVRLIRPGTALVIEDAGGDVGSIGSNNILSWKAKGCVGVVCSSTARDTDEIIAEKVPLYFRHPGRGIRPGRNEIESVNRPVVCGGVLVIPGDVIVADGDGVVVVPRAKAELVARFARQILEKDKASRRSKYQQLGLPPDASVK